MKRFLKKNWRYFIPVLVFVLAFSLTYLFMVLKNNTKTGEGGAPKENISLNTNPAKAPSDRTNVLLLGYGGAGHEGSMLMDSIILVSVSTKTKKAALISIPRDLWFIDHKINEGYVKGGSSTTGWNEIKNVITSVTGLPINDYVAVDFGGFVKEIDTLGGVDVNVPSTYDDFFYPIAGEENNTCGKSAAEIDAFKAKYSGFDLEKQFECRYEHIRFDKGLVHMDGTLALKYTRSRHGDNDFGRSDRQFAVLNAVKDKAISLDVVPKGGTLLSNLVAMVNTNLDVAGVKALYNLLGNPKDYQIVSIHLTDGNVLVDSTGPAGAFILIPKEGGGKWNAIQNYIFEKL